ncbi:MAG: hypothetical protein HYY06_31090 [Deltaproteobacteria bacterium]|nr:hypothetical protein [Deltaproteobacteria bacterium]
MKSNGQEFSNRSQLAYGGTPRPQAGEPRSPALVQSRGDELASPSDPPSAWTYLKRAALHPYHLLAVAGTTAFCMITGSVLLVLAGLGAELAYLRLVPMLRAFRRSIDAQLVQAEHATQARERESLLAQMDGALRSRFEKLEILVGRIHENSRRDRASVESALSDIVDPTRLTTTYVRLAIAHKGYCEYLATTSRTALQDQIRALEEAERGPAPAADRTRALRQQRLAIARERAARWDRTREDLDAIGHQLAAIEELIQLMHEQSITPAAPQHARVELERFMADLEENEATCRELAEIAAPDTPGRELPA